MWDEFKETLGSFATDTRSVDAVKGLTGAVVKLTDMVEANRGSINGWIDDSASFVKSCTSIAESLGKITGAFGTTGSAVQKLRDMIINVLFPGFSQFGKWKDYVVGAMAAIASGFEKVANAVQSVINKINIFNALKVHKKTVAYETGGGGAGGTWIGAGVGAGFPGQEWMNTPEAQSALAQIQTEQLAEQQKIQDGIVQVRDRMAELVALQREANQNAFDTAIAQGQTLNAMQDMSGSFGQLAQSYFGEGMRSSGGMVEGEDTTEIVSKIRGGFAKGLQTLLSGDFLTNLLSSGIGIAAGGGGLREIGAGLLPLIGSAFGPIGSAVGGLLGSLLGKKKQQTPVTEPIPVRVVNLGDLATAFLAATQMRRLVSTGAGMQHLTTELSLQAARVGVV
jgi:phage-related protein